MKSVIYETRGRAREFNELAINLFTGCGHQCVYCYGANVTHQSREMFENEPKPRVTPGDVQRSAADWAKKGEKRSILLCFVTDPYQPIEAESRLTRTTIETLKRYGLRVTILTKAGMRATRDFDMLKPGEDAFAVTLTCMNSRSSLKWEPKAALPVDRIRSLQMAKDRGLETWVSLEPVIYPADSMELMNLTREFVDHYKVGTMNYHPHGKSIDWKAFGFGIKSWMDEFGVKYYLKNDLRKEMDLPQGIEQGWSAQ